MKNKDRLTIVVFIVLIIMIIGLFIYNIYSDNKNNIDRNLEYIFDDYTYQMVYTTGSELFSKGIDLLINDKVLEYEKKLSGKYNYYSVDNCNNCKKIVNAVVFTNILTNSELNKYMENNNIFKNENFYYIEKDINYLYNKKYIGSIIDIDSYNKEYVYFKSINYYCDNDVKYIGLLEEEPKCNYHTSNSSFKIKLENNNLRLDNLDELKNIVK